MATKYLYIDDNFDYIVGGHVSALSISPDFLEVIHKHPTGDWRKERDFFLNGSFFEEFDGLILDLRLDDEVNPDGNLSPYKGTSVAQELRTLATENKIADIPIVLLSATSKIRESLDSTGEDLFDIRISKEKLPTSFESTKQKLVSLSNAYKKFNTIKVETQAIKWVNSILGIDLAKSLIDKRFTAKLLEFHSRPIHSTAYFIIQNLLESDGVLINQDVLAARLGVDTHRSEDWDKLLEKFVKAIYKGVFHEGWKVWWSHLFEQQILELIENEVSFRNLDAETRVNLLKEKLGLNRLYPSSKLPFSKSTAFWTICRGNLKPIDPIDGLIISNQENNFPWQLKKYVSIEEALSRRNLEKWGDVATAEKERLEKLKIIHRRERSR